MSIAKHDDVAVLGVRADTMDRFYTVARPGYKPQDIRVVHEADGVVLGEYPRPDTGDWVAVRFHSPGEVAEGLIPHPMVTLEAFTHPGPSHKFPSMKGKRWRVCPAGACGVRWAWEPAVEKGFNLDQYEAAIKAGVEQVAREATGRREARRVARGAVSSEVLREAREMAGETFVEDSPFVLRLRRLGAFFKWSTDPDDVGLGNHLTELGNEAARYGAESWEDFMAKRARWREGELKKVMASRATRKRPEDDASNPFY